MGKKKIAIVGTGAVGGYTGAHMVQAGEDVTFIDPWPEHVETMRRSGLRITHTRDEAVHGAGARAAPDRGAATRQGGAGRHRLRLHEILRHRVGGHADPAVPGARRLCRVAAELHERGDDRRDRRLGQDARLHRQQYQRRPADRAISIAAGKGGAAHTVYRTGEVHGRITERAQEVGRLVALCRQRQGDRQSVGRALVEARRQLDGQRAFGLHRAVRRADRKTDALVASRRGSAARRSASARRSATSSRRSTICRRRPSRGPARAMQRHRGRSTSSG